MRPHLALFRYFRLLMLALGAALLWLHPLPSPAELRTTAFNFSDIEGKSVRLTDFKGKWVLVTFWAYWCPLCRVQIPTLNALNQRPDLVVIGVGMDYGQDPSLMRAAISSHGMDYHAQVAGGSRRDPQAAFRQVGPVDFFPTSYLYSPEGELVMFIPGQLRQTKVLAFMDNWQFERGGIRKGTAYAMNTRKFESSLRQRFGAAGTRAYKEWRDLTGRLAGAPVAERLKEVNDFFNRRIQTGDDRSIWGKEDYWATPGETLSLGKGDSEDRVIAKYFTLLSLDVPAEQLRLVYARRRGSGKDASPVHMVLAYYPQPTQEPLLLDDNGAEPQPASSRPELRPTFSFNSQDVWGDVGNLAGQSGEGAARLPVWQDTLRRAREEGFE